MTFIMFPLCTNFWEVWSQNLRRSIGSVQNLVPLYLIFLLLTQIFVSFLNLLKCTSSHMLLGFYFQCEGHRNGFLIIKYDIVTEK